ncbi:hypothetical protein L0Y59_02185 [Candidatus Uhrbacteria bacterium]|nr:hypothetical protein [Candidatus Uhrbacteria bacterium]
MYKPHQGNRSGGWKGSTSFGQKKPWDRGSAGRSDDRPMFKAVCSECGDPCEVPFKPLPGRAIFCRNCFRKDGDVAPRRPTEAAARPFRPTEQRPDTQVMDRLKAIETKLDAMLKMLSPVAVSTPTADIEKPVVKTKGVTAKEKKTAVKKAVAKKPTKKGKK